MQSNLGQQEGRHLGTFREFCLDDGSLSESTPAPSGLRLSSRTIFWNFVDSNALLYCILDLVQVNPQVFLGLVVVMRDVCRKVKYGMLVTKYLHMKVQFNRFSRVWYMVEIRNVRFSKTNFSCFRKHVYE